MAGRRVAVLVGPTAVGKTTVALDLAEGLGAEIVNADSMQVYRELDIGTAKPTSAERARVRHHLVDVAAPDEPYDAARYVREGRAVLADLHRLGIPPLVVGGTGLYIKALLAGIFYQDEAVHDLRPRLARELADQGLAALYARLAALDPATAQRLSPGDSYRILRALEVALSTGKSLSDWVAETPFGVDTLPVVRIGLTLPRAILYDRIAARVGNMLQDGWLEEVTGLLSRGVSPSTSPAFEAIGYRQLAEHLRGDCSLEEATDKDEIEELKQAGGN